MLPDGKTEVELEVGQFVPYLLDTGDTAIHKPSSSSRCYPVVLSHNYKSLDNSIGENWMFDANERHMWTLHNASQIAIVDPSQ